MSRPNTTSPAAPPEPLPEVLLDKMIGVLEGPVNRATEKVLGSKLVLTPVALALNVCLRAVAFVAGRKKERA